MGGFTGSIKMPAWPNFHVTDVTFQSQSCSLEVYARIFFIKVDEHNNCSRYSICKLN